MLRYVKAARKKVTHWEPLHNEIFGTGGQAGLLFPTRAERESFARTTESKEIRSLIYGLPSEPEQYSGKFMVRVPKSIHASLQRECEREGVSMNQLVVAKLALNLNQTVNTHG